MDLWIEKYRPQKIDDMLLEPQVRKTFESFIETGDIPHLMLVGGPGCGKTTIAKILIKALGAESLELNASDERGIDMVRDKVKSFMMMGLLPGKTSKIIFFDEADEMTENAQTALRRMLEDFSDSVRVIFSLNYPDRMIEPIVSRCQVFNFQQRTKAEVVKLFVKVLDAEKVSYDVDDLLEVAEGSKGDLRKGLGTLQRDTTGGKFKYTQVIYGSIDANRLVLLTKQNSWELLYKEIGVVTNYMELYKSLFDIYWLSNTKAIKIIGEYMFRHSSVLDKQMNLLCCFRELSQYIL